MTAYFGLFEVGQPKAGETVVVSAASGAVGQVVGQLAKIAGCRAVGIAGGAKKCAFVKDKLGFDACIDYKAEKDLTAAVQGRLPERRRRLLRQRRRRRERRRAAPTSTSLRASPCAGRSRNTTPPSPGPRLLGTFVGKRVTARGFIVWDFNAQVWAGAAPDGRVGALAAASSIREDIVEGIDKAPRAFIGLLRGENFGKLQVKLGPDPRR